MSDLIDRQTAIEAVGELSGVFSWIERPDVYEVLRKLPSAQPDKDLIHLQKEQAYMQGYEDGRKPRTWNTYFCPNCGAMMVDK